MSDIDSFKTVARISQGIYKEKGSKFLAHAFPVKEVTDIEKQLTELKTKHPKSRHLCYAYRLGMSEDHYRVNDDGEPSGTAGLPIYNEIQSYGLTNILVVVVRYFGGTKLGASGLIHAYRSATHEALEASEIIDKYLTDRFTLHYPIEKMGIIYNILKQNGVHNLESQYEPAPVFHFSIRKSKSDQSIRAIIASYHQYPIDDFPMDYESPDLLFTKI